MSDFDWLEYADIDRKRLRENPDQADLALDIITNYIPDLDEARAFDILRQLKDRFGWAGTMFCREDISIRAREAAPEASDDRIDDLCDNVMESDEWKHMAEWINSTGWEQIDDTLRQFGAFDEEPCPICEGSGA